MSSCTLLTSSVFLLSASLLSVEVDRIFAKYDPENTGELDHEKSQGGEGSEEKKSVFKIGSVDFYPVKWLSWIHVFALIRLSA